MADVAEPLRLTDGQLDFAGGVQSDTVRTKRLPQIPNGIRDNQVAWLINGQVRGGAIGLRPSLQPLVQGAPWTGIFQGAFLYQPDASDPILLLAIGGELWRVRVDTDLSVTNLSTLYGPNLTMPPNEPQAFFAQAEMFAVWQCGDNVTNPIFFDFGVESVRPETMRRSNGFIAAGDPGNEIPAAGPMDYYAQRLWYAFDRRYAAGDIVANKTSGTAPYFYRDSILKVTENPVAKAGDAFVVPTSAGNIRALKHAANLDSTLGESQLFIFTRRAVYTNTAPITRDEWTAADLDTMPLQKIALVKGGTQAERSVVAVNGDLFFQSPPNGDIRSVSVAQRSFQQWGNVPLSRNINRLLQFNDRALLRYASGIEFDNRLLETALPVATPVGVAFKAVAALDFDIISTFEERLPPAWEGVYDFSGGPYILQVVEGDFGGRERAFAVVWSTLRQAIEVWELRPDLRFDNTDARITRVVEFPAYASGDPLQLKQLDSGDLWFDKVLGDVDVEVYYRPDGFSCWLPWHAFQLCATKNCADYGENPCNGYPLQDFCEQDAVPITLPRPKADACITLPVKGLSYRRPTTQGYQFQVKVVTKGWCRIRGLILHALPLEEAPYSGLACVPPATRL